jgi:hypothetical protein
MSGTCNFSLRDFIAPTGCARGSVNDTCGIFSRWSIFRTTAAITVRVPSRSFLCFRWHCNCLVGGTKLHSHAMRIWIPAPNTTCLAFSRISIILSVCACGFPQKRKFDRGSRDQKKTLAFVRCVLLSSFSSTAADKFTFPGNVAIPDSWWGSDVTSIPLDFCEMLSPSAYVVKFQWFYCLESELVEPTYHSFPKIIANASLSKEFCYGVYN